MTGKRQTGAGTVQNRSDRLSQLRLLIALDALLREGSVSRAAAGIGLQVSAMSRMLGKLREIYGDPLFIRTGKGLLPTPLAESLRMRVRALADESDHLLVPSSGAAAPGVGSISGWERPALIEAPPLAVRPSFLLDGQPSPSDFARKLSRIGHNADPQQRLAKYIATAGVGPGKSRPLTQDEAKDALSIILAGDADPVQIGALLATMQYRGATAAELAGFVAAMQAHVGALDRRKSRADLDWPAYLSPKLRSPPWFLHAARLVAAAGHRVVLHGHCGGGAEAGKLEMAAELSGIPVCRSTAEATAALDRKSIAYIPIGVVAPQMQALLGLYSLVEMRLPLNTVVHLLNPMRARNTLLGVAQPSQRELHRDIATLLGITDLTILGNTRDFAQFTPYRQTSLFRLVGGETQDMTIPAQLEPAALPVTGMTSREYWQAVWSGAARDERAETTIVTTAAIALMILAEDKEAGFDESYRQARELWASRRR
ncbi:MAG: glycosyl transferase family protein [Shinella sp.]|nr:glycosyl transferase family protein [Shinella sp.]